MLFRCLLLFLPTLLFAQTPASDNLFSNGGFEEKAFERDDLWDGVTADGYLSGATESLPVLRESGSVEKTPMPVSVNVVDLNGDGLLDLVVADPAGYLRVFFNRGSKTEPKFDHCEIVPFYLSPLVPIANRDTSAWRKAPRICLYDFGKRGVLDLVVGNYLGEVFFIPNTGSTQAPEFRQPDDLNKLLLHMTNELWGNLLAPAACDWDGDGKVDLLLGEGSYSANSIHLFLNQAGGTPPRFSEAARSYLAFGDGKEGLVPALVDFNGDGKLDLLVADRTGQVSVFLNPGNWKPGVELPFSSYVTFGGSTKIGGMITVAAADLNGDGLFDIIIGKSNGHIAVAYNTGTKTEPKFDAPVDLKGEKLFAPLHLPTRWVSDPNRLALNLDSGFGKGNFYGYFSVVDSAEDKISAPAEGTHVLKAGYSASPNKVFRGTGLTFEQRPKTEAAAVPNLFTITRSPEQALKVGATYTLSFKVKGNFTDGAWTLAYRGYKEITPAKIERGERNSAKITRNEVKEDNLDVTSRMSGSSNWVTVTRTFDVKFKNRELADLGTTTGADLELHFTLPSPTAVFYLDDVQLVEKKAR